MPLKKYSFKVAWDHNGKRLDQVLTERFPAVCPEPLSKAKIRKLIVAGAVYLNGRRVRIASKPVPDGAKIDVYLDAQRLLRTNKEKDAPFEVSSSSVLYEDEFLIAIDKPAGIPTQPTVDEARNNLYSSLKKFLARRERRAEVYLGLHHRLDRDTSGVIVFTKNPSANPGIAALFSAHQAEKVYHAIAIRPDGFTVGGNSGRGGRSGLTQDWSVKNYLGRMSSSGKKSKYGSVFSGGDFAHTDFTLLETLRGGLWIEARPRTGRTHQIRIHLSESGIPILGDDLYGPGSPKGGAVFPVTASRMMLHAVRLTFQHPIHKNELSIQSALPGDFVRCLRCLK